MLLTDLDEKGYFGRPMRASMVAVALTTLLGLSLETKALETKWVKTQGRMIVAFVPSEMRDAQDDGAVEAVAHLRYAIEDTMKCLGPMKLTVKFFYADNISVRNGRNCQFIRAHRLGQAVGAVLLESGRGPLAVYSVEGPSTLRYLLPQAALKYWHLESCAQ